MSDARAQLRALCGLVNFHKLDECFARVVAVEGKCSLCSEEVVSLSDSADVHCHMHLLFPTGTLWVHGSGPDIDSASCNAAEAAVEMMT